MCNYFTDAEARAVAAELEKANQEASKISPTDE